MKPQRSQGFMFQNPKTLKKIKQMQCSRRHWKLQLGCAWEPQGANLPHERPLGSPTLNPNKPQINPSCLSKRFWPAFFHIFFWGGLDGNNLLLEALGKISPKRRRNRPPPHGGFGHGSPDRWPDEGAGFWRWGEICFPVSVFSDRFFLCGLFKYSLFFVLVMLCSAFFILDSSLLGSSLEVAPCPAPRLRF